MIAHNRDYQMKIHEPGMEHLEIVHYEQSFRFIISQPFIKGKQPSRKQIDDFMSGLGFSKSKLNEDWYETDFLNVTDMHTKNALVDEKGNIYVIDDVIERR